MRLGWKLGVAALCLSVGSGATAAELENPPDMRRNADGQYDLEAVTAEYTLPPFTDRITSRSFISRGTGKWDEKRKRLVAPTLRAAPGEHVRLRLTNRMKPAAGDGDFYPFDNAHDSGKPAPDGPHVDTLPHGFDILNMHTHGLHVTPQGNSDNVLLNILPEGSSAADLKKACHAETDKDVAHRHVCVEGAFDYEYRIPDRHPAGTFWYHPHKHGSVAMHLASGMGGALIIEDKKNGIDSLDAIKQAKALNGERILVIQEIEYTRSNPVTVPDARYAVNCQSVYGSAICAQIGNTSTQGPTVNAKLSVNGQMDPTITMAPGEAMLWRVINISVGNNLPFCLVPAPTAGKATPSEVPALYALAADGIPIQQPKVTDKDALPFKLAAPVYDLTSPTAGRDVINNELTIMAPGQRLDLMVQAPQGEGRYALIQPDPVNAPTSMTSLCQPPAAGATIPADQLVMYVEVKKHSRKVNKAVPTQVELNRLYTPDDVASRKDVPAGPTQGVVFGFTNAEYAPSAIGGASVVNGRPFNLERVQRKLKLEQTDRWGVQSASDTHMFHIHINSFQIIQRGSIKYDFPIWRDTALINCATGPGGCSFPAGNTIQQKGGQPGGGGSGEVLQFVSRALDFTGPMVLHCHNVNHEDNGMMELLELVK